MSLVSFVIAFPIGVAAAFFYVLWDRPYVFYPPQEYGPSVDVTQYVSAMRQQGSKEVLNLDSLASTIETGLMERLKSIQEGATLEPDNAIHLDSNGTHTIDIREVAAFAAQAVRDNYVVIEVGPEFRDARGRYSVAYMPSDPVSDLGDQVYFLLAPHVSPYTLGNDWALYDQDTGLRMEELESPWSRGETTKRDRRTAFSVGVRPGMTLRVLPLGGFQP